MADDFWDEPGPVRAGPRDRLGPIFTASYDGECPACWEEITEGAEIRADGAGGYIHADDYCEGIAVREMK